MVIQCEWSCNTLRIKLWFHKNGQYYENEVVTQWQKFVIRE